MELIDAILNRTPEKPLFHYTDAQGLLGILRTKRIWASSVYHLNDSSEFRYPFELISDILRSNLKHENGPNNRKYGILLDDMPTVTQYVQAYVASFTEDGDLLSQWLTYPRAPNGYALGFSPNQFVTATNGGFLLVPCIYAEAQQLELANAMIVSLLELVADPEIVTDYEAMDSISSRVLTVAAALKHPGFAREAEWRLIKTIPVGFGKSKEVSFRQGRNGVVPYLQAPLVAEDAEQFVPAAIHIGPNEDMRAAQIAINTLLDHDGLYELFGQQVQIEASKTPYRP